MPVPFTRAGCRMGLGTNWHRSKGRFLKNDKTLTSLKDPRALGEVNQEGIQGSPRGDDYKEEVLWLLLCVWHWNLRSFSDDMCPGQWLWSVSMFSWWRCHRNWPILSWWMNLMMEIALSFGGAANYFEVFMYLFILEPGPCCLAWADPKLVLLTPLSSEDWDYRPVPADPALCFHL